MHDQRSASEHVSPSLYHSSLPLSASSLRKTKKECSSHSDREQRKTWPGLSPLRRPDWTSPAERALLPCGWRGRQTLRALLWTQSHLSSPVKEDLHRRLRAAVMTRLWLNERKPQQLLFVSGTLANDERLNECRLTGNYSESPRCCMKSSVIPDSVLKGLCIVGCRSGLSFHNGSDQFACLHDRKDLITGSNHISIIIGSEKWKS